MTLWRPISAVDKGLVLFIKGSGKPFLSLKIGDVVKAEVLEIVSGNRVLINLKNKVVEAKTEVPLKVGEGLLLKVESKEDEVRLRMVKDTTRTQDWLKTTINSALNNLKGAKPDIRGLGVLRAILSKIPDGAKEGLEGSSILKRFTLPIENLSGNLLKDLLESSGVFFETKLRLLVLKYIQEGISKQDVIENLPQVSGGLKDLHLNVFMREEDKGKEAVTNPYFREGLTQIIKSDLKGALLKLKGLLKSGGFIERLVRSDIKPDELSNLIDRLVKTIEYHQLYSRLNESFQTFVPLLWETLKEGELIFKETHRDPSGRRSYYCIIRLELERMGKLVVLVIMQQEGFYISFVTDNKTFFNLLQETKGFLGEQFDASGLKLGNLMTRYEERIDFESNSKGLDIRI